MGKIFKLFHDMKAVMIMMVVQICYAGVNIFYKLASNNGMSLRILVAYRFIFATLFILPLALILERNKRPKLTWVIVIQGFFCGLFGGSLGQNLFVESLALTSATFASAMTNLVPAITFILAISFGLEKLGLRTSEGKAKIVGTIMGISGAMLLTLYKGEEINIWSTNINLLHHQGHYTRKKSSHRILGALFALGSCFSYALWLIIQTKMSEKYPCQYSSTAIMATMGSIQSVVFALCVERDWNQWKLGWNIRLLTVAYSGIVGTGLMVTLIAWCVRMKGPLFVSVFTPLMLVLVALAGSLFLDEHLYLGSMLGAVLIVCGLYAVLWGKGKEMKKRNQITQSKSTRESESIEIIVNSSSNNDTNGTEKHEENENK